jgi:GT2 family glycosyltransferase
VTTNWIVVLNWHGRADTLELLDSLAAADLLDTTVLVVDNGSFDGTLEVVQRRHPTAHCLQTGRNLGYAGGNNVGIRHAMRHGADVIAVMNNDTLVEPSFWPPLVAAAREGHAVSPDIRYADGSGRSWFYGGTSRPVDGRPRHLQDDEQPPRSRRAATEILTGCCLVASTRTWRLVGGFDEQLFLIFEDADWSLRARRLGVELLLEPTSRIDHKVSRSLDGPARGIGDYFFCRNGLVFAARWLGMRGLLTFWADCILRASIRDLRTRRPGSARAALVRLLALSHACLGVGGPAKPWVSRLASTRTLP